MRRQESRGNFKSIKPSHALISRRVSFGRFVPVVESTTPVERERLFDCEHFRLWRLRGQSPFVVGSPEVARVLVCIEGEGNIEHGGADYAVGKGDVFLLPAVIGACAFQPSSAVTLLEIALPD